MGWPVNENPRKPPNPLSLAFLKKTQVSQLCHNVLLVAYQFRSADCRDELSGIDCIAHSVLQKNVYRLRHYMRSPYIIQYNAQSIHAGQRHKSFPMCCRQRGSVLNSVDDYRWREMDRLDSLEGNILRALGLPQNKKEEAPQLSTRVLRAWSTITSLQGW